MLLQVIGLSKSFSGRRVVNSVEFYVDAGEVVGLLGPNGAGKTTTFRMTVGIVAPEKGLVIFDGEDINRSINLVETLLSQDQSVNKAEWLVILADLQFRMNFTDEALVSFTKLLEIKPELLLKQGSRLARLLLRLQREGKEKTVRAFVNKLRSTDVQLTGELKNFVEELEKVP